MAEILLDVITGAAAGAITSVLLYRRYLSQGVTSVAAPPPAEAISLPEEQPASPLELPTPAPVASPVAAPIKEIASLLPLLHKALSPLAEDLDHPSVLPDLPEFQAVLEAFRRPDATLPLLTRYALGGNWPFACAAFTVLAQHPDRQSLRDQVVRHIEHIRPYTMPFAFEFLTSLPERPPVGAPLLGASPWWQNNAVIPDFFVGYFEKSESLGDRPSFGTYLETKIDFDKAAVEGLLKKIQHRFASGLLSELHSWTSTRIDGEFLATIGTVLKSDQADPLLVAPPAWHALLDTAGRAILQGSARSVLVTGEALTGKTAFIDLLGRELQDHGWTVFSAAGHELMADQMYIGQLEGRIRKLVDELHPRRRIVWHIRDFGQIADSGTHKGQSASILDQIFPAIVAGNLIVIGEASGVAATRLFQARPSLRSVVEILPLMAMSEPDTAELAAKIATKITQTLGLGVAEPALAATLELAQQYLGSGHLPGSVLELLKRAAQHSIGAGETTLTPTSVIATLSLISGLPQVILDTRQRVELAQVHTFFAGRVIGQDEAVRAVVDRIAMLKAGLTDPGRPIGVFLFAGPTGTGKTELAKTLAEFLFGSTDRMARLDMSEFQTHDSTSKILGQRGEANSDSLIERIRKQPFSVILLDEFEKAHANCWDLFLQIFDDGRLSDANGREADFRHCFIILTSNLGAAMHRGGGLGFRPGPADYAEDQVLETVAKTFRPEFINRLDKIIVFRPLSRDLMRSVLHKELARVEERRGLRDRAWAVEWEASAIEFLLDRGFSREMGARPLKRAIDQLLLAPLAATLVEHRFPEGDQFLFVRSNGREIEVEFVDPDGEAPEIPAQQEPDTDPSHTLSLPAIVLRQTGSAEERATLTACWHGINAELASEDWGRANEQRQHALADPGFWSREDRFRTLSAIEMADRLQEAARTADRLFQRYDSAGEHTARASRELAARLALQLFNLRQGLADIAADAPIDALLRVSPAMDAGGDGAHAASWCRSLTGMYAKWAVKRRLQIKEIKPADARTMPILHVSGFGAFRTLAAEAGLHVLDDPALENARRTVARVTVTGGPEEDFPEATRYAAASRLLATMSAGTAVIRRYREDPAPMVRDGVQGWRTGRLDAVLGGDFDLIGAVARGQAA